MYRAHAPSLYLFVLRILGEHSREADDIVQETWIRAVQALSGFRWNSSFHSWLCSIALNCCREFRRHYRQNSQQDADGIASSLSQDSFSGDLERCLLRLPDGCREVLVLHDVEGYTHKEIAELMEISEGTSKSQLFRARAKLRELLKPQKEIS